jgi:hypothetical protein
VGGPVREIIYIDLMKITDPNKADDNETVLLDVGRLLKAK